MPDQLGALGTDAALRPGGVGAGVRWCAVGGGLRTSSSSLSSSSSSPPTSSGSIACFFSSFFSFVLDLGLRDGGLVGVGTGCGGAVGVRRGRLVAID